MLCVVKMSLKGEVRGRTLISHGNYIVDRGKSWKSHGIVFLNFCGNPVIIYQCRESLPAPCSTKHSCCNLLNRKKYWLFLKSILFYRFGILNVLRFNHTFEFTKP